MKWGRCGALAAALVLLAAAMGWPPARAQKDERRIHERWVDVEGPTGEDERAYVLFPFRNDRKDHAEDQRYPLIVALHGKGEVSKGPTRGPRGWIADYRLPDAFGALQRGSLTAQDYQGLVTPSHLATANAELASQSFEGAMVVTPYVRDVSTPTSDLTVADYAAWVAGPLLEQVREEFSGAAQRRESVGIDGVSLGGWLSLETGLRHPDVFGSVGGIQPAVRGETEQLADRARAVYETEQTQHIRLLTSEEDPYLAATRKLSERLREHRVPHTLAVLPGRHDYEFNRGPGTLELLRFHTRVLRSEPM
ncbi:MAG: alpha/beta hydrolase [Myxococcota bacterium]